MTKWFTLLCVAASAVALTSCSSVPATADSHDADVKAINDDLAQWQKDFAAKDLDKLASHYTDDAIVANPGSPAVTGRDAAKSATKDFIADPAFALAFSPDKVDVAKAGDVAYAHGHYTLTVTNPATKQPIHDKGFFLELYKKQADGSWKCALDMATSEMPSTASPAPPAK